MTPSLSVLIATHGRPRLLRRTLRSLAECRLPPGYAETVLVENGSKLDAEVIVAETSGLHASLNLRYLHVSRANKSHALNVALRTMRPGLVVFFDDDVRVDPGTLNAYAEAAARHSAATFFGGSVLPEYEVEPQTWMVPHLPLSYRGYDVRSGERPSWYYLGANWATYTDAISNAGEFDPNFGPGSPTGASGQETNMQRRLLQRGLSQVDVKEAVVWHYVPRDTCSTLWLARRKYAVGIQIALKEVTQKDGFQPAFLEFRLCARQCWIAWRNGDRARARDLVFELCRQAGIVSWLARTAMKRRARTLMKGAR